MFRKKYIWLLALLFIYFFFMTWWFGRDILASGQSARFWITVGAETLVLILLSYFLRLKAKAQEQRELEDFERKCREIQNRNNPGNSHADSHDNTSSDIPSDKNPDDN